MKTVDKAMTVLSQFSLEKQEIGLSELSRMAGLDKAATRRLLVAMSNHGFIEQVSETKEYRLGYGFLALARIREATVPLTKAAQEISDELGQQVEESNHISVPGPKGMVNIAYCLPHRGNVINITAPENIPYHATASGLAYLAFSTPETQKKLLALKREKYAPYTLIARKDIIAGFQQTRAAGFSECRDTFEVGVASVAMPFFMDDANPCGCIAIAVPGSNMNAARQKELLVPLKAAVRRLEQALSGIPNEARK